MAAKAKICERCGSSFIRRGTYPEQYICDACGHEGEDD